MKDNKLIFIMLWLIPIISHAQQSFNQPTLDSMLLAHCMTLKVAQLEQSRNQAILQQERLWDNPKISIEQNIYNPNNKRYFDLSPAGESIVNIEQSLPKFGETKQRRMLARECSATDSMRYQLLVAELRKDLHQNIIQAHYAEKASSLYEQLTQRLSILLQQMELQCQQGQIAAWTVERIRTLLLTLQVEQMEYITAAQQSRSQSNLLLGLSESCQWSYQFTQSLTDVVDAILCPANDNLPKILLAQQELRMAQQEVNLQDKLSQPGLSISVLYDKAGNFINNYFAIGFSLELPISNRNQGNRRWAQLGKMQAEHTLDQITIQTKSQLALLQQQLRESLILYSSIEKQDAELEKMKEAMANGLQKRQVNITEFVDFYQGYKEAMLNRYAIEHKAWQLIEEIRTIQGE